MTYSSNYQKSGAPKIIEQLPLFPLNTVLFPDGPLSLKVFEPRYLDMLTQCEKNGTGFGIFSIKSGSEVGIAPEISSIGSIVSITFWEKRNDGLLGISVIGNQKIKLINKKVLDDQLTVADVEILNLEKVQPVPEQYQLMVNVLKKMIGNLNHPYITLEKKYQDATWLGSRLSELLPLSLEKKQQLLELEEPMSRLAMLYDEMLTLNLLSEL
jgi:uncharacterized protein